VRATNQWVWRLGAYLARADKISGEDDDLRGHVTDACVQQDLRVIERYLPGDYAGEKIREVGE